MGIDKIIELHEHIVVVKIEILAFKYANCWGLQKPARTLRGP